MDFPAHTPRPHQATKRKTMAEIKAGQAGSKMIRATVARGRTVVLPTEQKTVSGYMEDGKPAYRLLTREFGPGTEVELPAEEIAELRKQGYLVDPEKIAPPRDEGGRFEEPGREPPGAKVLSPAQAQQSVR
jgi:hypothetical protein